MLDENYWIKDPNAKSISFYTKGYPTIVNKKTILELENFWFTEKKDIRLCLHANNSALAHDMLILQSKETYCRPHYHEGKGECFHINKGVANVVLFSGDGLNHQNYEITEGELFRIPPSSIHAIYSKSDYCIYHESKEGPFKPDNDSIYPEWSPILDPNGLFQKKLNIK
jgi:cupin fold WbuC family metalloprotein